MCHYFNIPAFVVDSNSLASLWLRDTEVGEYRAQHFSRGIPVVSRCFPGDQLVSGFPVGLLDPMVVSWSSLGGGYEVARLRFDHLGWAGLVRAAARRLRGGELIQVAGLPHAGMASM